MNIVEIIPKLTKLTLSKEQLTQCEEKCFGYISPNSIGVTSGVIECGLSIKSDNVIAQKDGVQMRVEGDIVRVTGKIDGQEVIATTSKKLMYFSNCERKFKKFDDDKVTYYSGCKHVKFIVGDIYIGN
jgi:hypothetical protein